MICDLDGHRALLLLRRYRTYSHESVTLNLPAATLQHCNSTTRRKTYQLKRTRVWYQVRSTYRYNTCIILGARCIPGTGTTQTAKHKIRRRDCCSTAALLNIDVPLIKYALCLTQRSLCSNLNYFILPIPVQQQHWVYQVQGIYRCIPGTGNTQTIKHKIRRRDCCSTAALLNVHVPLV